MLLLDNMRYLGCQALEESVQKFWLSIHTGLRNLKKKRKKKSHLSFVRPSSSWVIDHYKILHALINNSRVAWPTGNFDAISGFLRQFTSGSFLFLFLFLFFAFVLFFDSVDIFGDNAQNIQILVWSAVPPKDYYWLNGNQHYFIW